MARRPWGCFLHDHSPDGKGCRQLGACGTQSQIYTHDCDRQALSSVALHPAPPSREQSTSLPPASLGRPARKGASSLKPHWHQQPCRAGQGRPRLDGRLPGTTHSAPGCHPLLPARSWLALGAPCTGKRNARIHQGAFPKAPCILMCLNSLGLDQKTLLSGKKPKHCHWPYCSAFSMCQFLHWHK